MSPVNNWFKKWFVFIMLTVIAYGLHALGEPWIEIAALFFVKLSIIALSAIYQYAIRIEDSLENDSNS